MSALVKILPKAKYLNLPEYQKTSLRQTEDLMGVHFGAKIIVLGGEKDGQIVEEVKANQFVKLVPDVDLRISKYTALVGYNPKLAEFGLISCTSFIPAGEDVSLTLKALKGFDIKDLGYVFTLYLLD